MLYVHAVLLLWLFLVIERCDRVDSAATPMPHGRSRRAIVNQPNRAYQECRTPNGSVGHCRHVQYCNLSEFQQNYLHFLDYLCIIERSSVGVCCPDSLADRGGPSVVALPQQGDDEKLPIWGVSTDTISEKDINGDQVLGRPEERGCGMSTKAYPKITGGRPADPNEWPWMAALRRRGPPNAYCGGVLITDRHVLTAAHCTSSFEPSDITVRLGEYSFSAQNDTRSRDFRVVEIRQHVDFDATTYENDISVLKLQQAALFNSYIWPVCMPPVEETYEGYMAIVTGWGTQYFGGPSSDVLMEVSLPIWAQESCKSAFVERISDGVLCAGAPEGGRDSCQGDSGGPLLVQLPNRRWVTVGIVSWGIRCGEKNHPGIYTRVTAYTNWIIENAVF